MKVSHTVVQNASFWRKAGHFLRAEGAIPLLGGILFLRSANFAFVPSFFGGCALFCLWAGWIRFCEKITATRLITLIRLGAAAFLPLFLPALLLLLMPEMKGSGSSLANPLGGFKYVLGGSSLSAAFLLFLIPVLKALFHPREETFKDAKKTGRLLFLLLLLFLAVTSPWLRLIPLTSDTGVYWGWTEQVSTHLARTVLEGEIRPLEAGGVLPGIQNQIHGITRAKWFSGLSLLLVPFYGISCVLTTDPYLRYLFTLLPLCALFSLGYMYLYRLGVQLGGTSRDLFVFLALFFIASPLWLWGGENIPEGTGFFLVCYALWRAFTKEKIGLDLPFLAAVMLLPWMHPRHISAALLLIGLLFYTRRNFSFLPSFLMLLVSVGIKLGVRSFLKGETSIVASETAYVTFTEWPINFLRFFVDDRYGLLWNAPLALLLIAALLTRPKDKGERIDRLIEGCGMAFFAAVLAFSFHKLWCGGAGYGRYHLIYFPFLLVSASRLSWSQFDPWLKRFLPLLILPGLLYSFLYATVPLVFRNLRNDLLGQLYGLSLNPLAPRFVISPVPYQIEIPAVYNEGLNFYLELGKLLFWSTAVAMIVMLARRGIAKEGKN